MIPDQQSKRGNKVGVFGLQGAQYEGGKDRLAARVPDHDRRLGVASQSSGLGQQGDQEGGPGDITGSIAGYQVQG